MEQYYHGNGREYSYFEGWYFKHTAKEHTLILILKGAHGVDVIGVNQAAVVPVVGMNFGGAVLGGVVRLGIIP